MLLKRTTANRGKLVGDDGDDLVAVAAHHIHGFFDRVLDRVSLLWDRLHLERFFALHSVLAGGQFGDPTQDELVRLFLAALRVQHLDQLTECELHFGGVELRELLQQVGLAFVACPRKLVSEQVVTGHEVEDVVHPIHVPGRDETASRDAQDVADVELFRLHDTFSFFRLMFGCELLVTARGFFCHRSEKLLGIEVFEVLRCAFLCPETGEIGVSEQILELPDMHDLRTRHAVATAVTFEIITVVNALVIADRDASVMMTIPVDDFGSSELIGDDSLLPLPDIAHDGIILVEPIVRTVVGHRRLLLSVFFECQQQLDLFISLPLLLDETRAIAFESVPDLVEERIVSGLEEARCVELPLLVLHAGIGDDTARSRDVVVVATATSASELTPTTNVEGGCTTLPVDRRGVERFGVFTPAVLADADVGKLRILRLLGDLDDVRCSLATHQLQLLVNFFDLRAETASMRPPRTNHLADADLAEEHDVFDSGCR